MSFRSFVLILAIAAIGAAALFSSLVSAGKDYAKTQDARIKEMQAYGSGSR